MRGDAGVPEGSLRIQWEHRTFPPNTLALEVEEHCNEGLNLETDFLI